MNKMNELAKRLESLSVKEIDKVSQLIDSFQENKDKGDAITILCCPNCGSVSIKKHGKDKNKNQRFFCKDCSHSFSSKTKSFFFHNRISKSTWIKFIDYEITGISLKEEAHHLGLSVHTCFRMRHKLYSAVSSIVEATTKVQGTVQLDAAYQKINLKGTKPKNMPRYSKHRGKTSAFSGISHHKICIISAIDNEDNMFLKISGLGSESFEKYTECIHYIGEVDKIVSDSKQCMPHVANKLGVENDKIPVIGGKKRYTTPLGNHLGDLNELHTGIKFLIRRSHGVSTRFLQEYLDFYTFKKQIKYKKERNEISGYIYDLIKDTKPFKESDIVMTELPISLKEAYYEYRFGIFA